MRQFFSCYDKLLFAFFQFISTPKLPSWNWLEMQNDFRLFQSRTGDNWHAMLCVHLKSLDWQLNFKLAVYVQSVNILDSFFSIECHTHTTKCTELQRTYWILNFIILWVSLSNISASYFKFKTALFASTFPIDSSTSKLQQCVRLLKSALFEFEYKLVKLVGHWPI